MPFLPRPARAGPRGFVFLLALALAFALAVSARAPGLAAEGEGSGRAETPAPGPGPVWVIPVTGTIDLGLASFVRRAVKEAGVAGAAAVIVDLNTFGGRVDAATEIRDALGRSGRLTVAFVRERAWSAGALIALAADRIYMAPGASLGAAEPRPADPKTVSALRAEFEAMAERRGRRPEIAAAMVDQAVVVDGLSPAGEILTLTTEAALRHGYAEGAAGSLEELLDRLALGGRTLRVAEANWGERVARFLTDPVVSQVLLTLGLLGLLAELSAPGWGVPGSVGLLSLFLFFGGRFAVGLVGWEVVGLFLLGLLLLVLELFVITGFGIAGVAGVAAILTSLFLSFANAAAGARSLAAALLATAAGGYLLWRSGRRFGVWRRLILSSRLTDEEGYVAPPDMSAYAGRRGRSLTTLRPAGTVEIDGDRVDAVTEGAYVAAGREILVVRVEGTRVVVREVSGEGV